MISYTTCQPTGFLIEIIIIIIVIDKSHKIFSVDKYLDIHKSTDMKANGKGVQRLYLTLSEDYIADLEDTVIHLIEAPGFPFFLCPSLPDVGHI